MRSVEMANPRAPTFRGLPPRTRVYISSVLGTGAAALGIAIVLCAAGNLFEVFAPANFSFQPNLIIFLCGSLLLPPWAVAVLAVVSFAPGWITHRFRWYMVAFNVANYTLAGLAAHMIVR